MAPTTVTTIVLVLFGLGLLAMASWAWFGSWQPVVRRLPQQVSDDDVEAAVQQMRRAIEDYERQHRSP
jgi:cytochrome c-type biogenesis protein CcmH/NrfG